MLFGRKSERFIPTDPAQLSMFADLLADEAKEENETIEVKSSTRRKPKKTDHKGRQLLQDAAHLERRRTVIEPDVDTSNMVCIGEEVSEKLVLEEAQLYVEQTVRPKYVEKITDQSSDQSDDQSKAKSIIHIAEKPNEVFPQTIADVSLIVYLLVSKYVDHLPLYRLIEIFKRNQLKIPSSTINGWLHRRINLIVPLYEALKNDVMLAGYLQVDETTIRVLEKFTKKKKSHLGCYWVYHSLVDKTLFFEYQKGRDQSGPMELFADFRGVIQCDGYNVYEAIEKNNKNIRLIHCMAHARRKFEEALSNNREKSTFILGKMKKLYQVERMIRDYTLTDQRDTQLRNQFAKPILEQLDT